MSANRTFFRFAILSSFAIISGVLHPAYGQRPGGGSSSPGAGSVGSTGRSSTTSNPFPSSNPTYGSTGPYSSRSLFLVGSVLLDDGAKPSSDIRIERVCNGNPRLEGHTDSKGRFSLQLGQDMAVDPDASEEQTGVRGQGSGLGRNSNARGSGIGSYWNCDLRAAYPGYRSDVVSLAMRRTLDDPNVGTIVLHRLTNVQGSTISMTTAMAPKHAQKEYEKGLQLEQKGRLEEAEKHLVASTTAYPKYAIAWYELGQVQEKEGRPQDAKKSYEAAISSDAKYVSPYDRLAVLAAKEAHWEDAARFSEQVLQLNPVEFPGSYYCNAVANYNLHKRDQAEKSVKEVLKLDTGHRLPQAESLMAQILMEKGDYPGAAGHLRAYLTLVPNAPNADALRQQLQKLEQANAEAKK